MTRFRLILPAVVVAVVIAAIAIAVSQREAAAPVASAAPAANAEPQLKPIALVAPDGTLNAAPSAFEWKPLAGADAYELKLYADDARVLWTSPRDAKTTVERPASVALPINQQYHWQVQAFAGGKAIGESRLATFELF
jgi:hypothetical protein